MALTKNLFFKHWDAWKGFFYEIDFFEEYSAPLEQEKTKPSKTKGIQRKSVKCSWAKLQEGSQLSEGRKRQADYSVNQKGKLEEVGVQL